MTSCRVAKETLAGLAGGYAGGPGPLEVVAAQPAGYVYDLADEEEAGDEAGLEGFGVEVAGVYSAGGDFGFGVAFGAGGGDAPGVEVGFDGGEGGVGEGALVGVGGEVMSEEAVGPAGGEEGAEGGEDGEVVAGRVGAAEGGEDFAGGGKVEG